MYLNKKNDSFDFKYVRDFDVQALVNIISKWDSEWLIDTSRQESSARSLGYHSDTFASRLIFYPLQWCPGDKYSPQIVCNNEELWKLVEPIIKHLELIYTGRVGRVTLVKLPPNKMVKPHRDLYLYPNLVHRIHIPILTNEDVFFSIEDKIENLKVGMAWEVNNAKLHGCYNMGNSDRVHLMIDIIPNDLIGTNDLIILD